MKLPFKLWRAVLVCLGLLLVIFVGIIGWQFLSIRSGQQAYEKRIQELASKGTAVNEADVWRLHKEKSSSEFTDQWRAIFEELAKPEFQEASASLPYLGRNGAELVTVPPRGVEWEGETEARKFMVDWMQLRDRVRKLAIKSRAVYFPLEREIGRAHV